jgi:hypothetical protein
MHVSMIYPPKYNPANIAVKAILVGFCMLISLGNTARVLLPSLLPGQALVANGALLCPAPEQQPSVPEESSTEFPGSSELPEEASAVSIATPRKSPKKCNSSMQFDRVARYQSRQDQAFLAGSQIANSQFEYFYRNGCGTHLRC